MKCPHHILTNANTLGSGKCVFIIYNIVQLKACIDIFI